MLKSLISQIFKQDSRVLLSGSLALFLYASFIYLLTYLVSNFGETSFYSPGGHLTSILYSLLSLFCVMAAAALVRGRAAGPGRVAEYQVMILVSVLFYLPVAAVAFWLMRLIGNGWFSFLSVLTNTAYALLSFHLVIACFYAGILYFKEQSLASVKIAELQRDKVENELRILQQQLDPHFLFNNLHVLSAMIQQSKQAKAEVFLEKFADLYRYRLDHGKEEFIALSLELAHIKDYFFLINERFAGSYCLRAGPFNFAPDKVFLPPGTLQILLENAIKHNKATTRDPLTIEILQEGADRILIKNERRRKDYQARRTGLGLKNLEGLFKLHELPDLLVESNSEHFSVSVPLISMKYESHGH